MGSVAYSDWLNSQFDAVPSVRARAVALEAKITEGYLSALRSGRNERPSRERAERIALVFAKLRGLSEAETEALVAEALAITENSGPGERRHTSPSLATSRHSGARSDDAPAGLPSFKKYFQQLVAHNAR